MINVSMAKRDEIPIYLYLAKHSRKTLLIMQKYDWQMLMCIGRNATMMEALQTR